MHQVDQQNKYFLIRCPQTTKMLMKLILHLLKIKCKQI